MHRLKTFILSLSYNRILSWWSVVLIGHNTFFPEVKVRALALSVEPNNIVRVRFVSELVNQAFEAHTSLFFLKNGLKSGEIVRKKQIKIKISV
jgi:hypothetical protein